MNDCLPTLAFVLFIGANDFSVILVGNCKEMGLDEIRFIYEKDIEYDPESR